MNPPHLFAEKLFHRLLDESSALLGSSECAGVAIPADELHREIIVPLLPSMLADAAIRGHWNEQVATGFLARLARHLDGAEPAPRWLPGDFEIHVTASYSASPDARALADTLLSEDSLRDLTAALMNQLLDALWPSLALAPSAAIVEPQAPGDIARTIPPEEILPPAILAAAHEPEAALEIQPAPLQPAHQQPSRALIRALCKGLAASAVRRGLAANRAARDASAAIVARRILARAVRRPTSQRRPPHRASL